MLSADIQQALAAASERVGEVRAVIALQGILHSYRRLTRIDGKISHETLEAVSIVGAKIGTDNLVKLFESRIAARFPVEDRPERVEDAVETAPPVENQPERAEKPKRKRRRTA